VDIEGGGQAAVLPEPAVEPPVARPAAHPAPEPVLARSLLAENLRRLRTDAGVTVEQVVRAAHGHGLDWSATWLTGVERGSRGLSAEQLLALPVVLGDALGFRVTLTDLIATEAPVLLVTEAPVGRAATQRASVPAGYLRDLVTGQPVRRPFSGAPQQPGPVPEVSPAQRAAERLREIRRAGLGDVDIRALERARAGAGDAESRLARRLAVAPVVVVAAAASLWGRSLTEERDARVAAGDGPASTVSRRLTGELTARLDDAARRAAELERAEVERGEVERGEVERGGVEPAEPEWDRPAGSGAADWRDAPDT
jgi:transcriptional regulator with XRE-family HTH domain